jgi:hypothetical protein
MGEKRTTYRLLVRKPERKKPLRRPRLMWLDNIKMILEQIEWHGTGSIDLAQNRYRWKAFVDAVMNPRVP